MNARDVALFDLDRRALPNWPAAILHRRQRPTDRGSDPRDIALAEEIHRGVVKNLLLLQNLIEHYSTRRLKDIDPLVQKILAIGLYQLRFLTRIPASAAVNEAVKQARQFGRTHSTGFVNAVLRNATRKPDPTAPSRETQPADYARLVLSHPPELFERLAKLLGPEQALQFCEHDNQEPPIIVRLLPGARADQLNAEGITVTPHQFGGMFVVSGVKRKQLADWAEAGIAQAQDPTAAAVAEFCRIDPGNTILDRCAGMGTKLAQLRERTGESGRVIGMDPALPRHAALLRLIGTRRWANAMAYAAGWVAKLPRNCPKSFDRVLVDVPCSNSGVLPRRPEARYAQTAPAFESLAKLQLDILTDSAPAVGPGGLLIYSTCSIWEEENHARVEQFIAKHPDFHIMQERTALPNLTTDPTQWHDGGYVCLLSRE